MIDVKLFNLVPLSFQFSEVENNEHHEVRFNFIYVYKYKIINSYNVKPQNLMKVIFQQYLISILLNVKIIVLRQL